MGLDIKLEGSKELIEFFASTPKNFPNRVIQNISRQAARPILNEARRNTGIDGLLDDPSITKKVIVIARDKTNPTAAVVTLSNAYVNYKGKDQSVAKIFRHLSAGNQHDRKKSSGSGTGKVNRRVGDFIETAFIRKKEKAIEIINEKFLAVLKKAAIKAKM